MYLTLTYLQCNVLETHSQYTYNTHIVGFQSLMKLGTIKIAKVCFHFKFLYLLALAMRHVSDTFEIAASDPGFYSFTEKLGLSDSGAITL